MFHDAEETIEDDTARKQNARTGERIGLAQGLREGQAAIDLFFNNDYDGARELTQRNAEESIYHALGFGTFQFLKAVMTFEQDHVEEASRVLAKSVETIDKFRRKYTIGDTLGKIVKKKDYNEFTEMEVHAELVYAECLLLKAMLTIVENENLVSFVNAGLKLRQAYMSFKECSIILRKRDWSRDEHYQHFEGGVRLGEGTFHLTMSLLPSRITKLLEFAGFTGTKEVGMTDLLSCYRNKNCLRQFLASLVLLSYHLILSTHMGRTNLCDKRIVEEILAEKLAKYPKSAFFLFYKGRYEMISGRCEMASVWYLRANNSQITWPQFQHVGCWELLWSSVLRGLWREALVHADRLLQESRWSPCMYSYFKGVLYCELEPELTEEEREELHTLMDDVPRLKQRIAGKSIPIEKFVIKKSQKFKDQNGWLLLPGLELIYLCHGFSILSQDIRMVQRFHDQLVSTEKKLEKRPMSVDDQCLMELLRGMCLKHMGCPLQAEESFRSVVERGSKLVTDKYLAPYATVELALVLLDQGDVKGSQELLNVAKAQSKYSLESRLHFKIHAASNRIKASQCKNGELLQVPEISEQHSSCLQSSTSPDLPASSVHDKPSSSLARALSDFRTETDVNPLI